MRMSSLFLAANFSIIPDSRVVRRSLGREVTALSVVALRRIRMMNRIDGMEWCIGTDTMDYYCMKLYGIEGNYPFLVRHK